MTKIMLVEDDNNLREIYEARLLAEGYEIINAKDGEEALALAVKDKPDLIISDVMMPKISGFDMLDILRSTPDIKDTKVIMMTALSQADDKVRAERLGADRYLVKSQVTLEDVAKVAAEVIASNNGASTITATTQISAGTITDPTTNPVQTQVVADDPQITMPQPTPQMAQAATTLQVDTITTQTPTTVTPVPQQPISQDQTPVNAPDPDFQQTPQPTQSTSSTDDQPSIDTSTDTAPEFTAQSLAEPNNTPLQPSIDNIQSTNHFTNGKKIIQPLHDMTNPGPDLESLLIKEQLDEDGLVLPDQIQNTISNPSFEDSEARQQDEKPTTFTTPTQPGNIITPS